nr:hypothetical protein [Tanacetum cinerariifolium]
MGCMVYQMDVKSAFLYETIEEEVYVYQPLGFEDPDHPDKVYKMVKVLYCLHQAPRAWYETLANYLLENGFQRGKIDQTLFIKRQKGDILLVQIYVHDIIFGVTNKDLCKSIEKRMKDKFQMSSMGELTFFLGLQIYVVDIIFGATNKDLCKSFEKLMKDKFQMSSLGELTFFLGLQVNQKRDGIFISHDKYVVEILRKFGLTEGKSASTPIDTEKPLLKDPDGEDVDVHTYRSMIGSLMYLTSSRPDIMFAVCASSLKSKANTSSPPSTYAFPLTSPTPFLFSSFVSMVLIFQLWAMTPVVSLPSTLETNYNPLVHYLTPLSRSSEIYDLTILGQMSNLVALPTSHSAWPFMMKLTLVAERQRSIIRFSLIVASH